VTTAPLRVLMVEDSPSDAKIVAKHLEVAFEGLSLRRVDAATQLEAALAEPPWDVVISDYAMPGFDARAALEIVRGKDVAVPFIVVSGTIGEEKAVELIRAGAQDVVLKDRLFRLVSVVERELRFREERRVHARDARALEESNVRLRRLAEAGVIGIIVSSVDGRILEANDAFLRIVRHSRDDLEQGLLDWKKLTPPDWAAANATLIARIAASGTAAPVEKEYLCGDGTRVPVIVSLAKLDDERNVALVADLSEQRHAQAELQVAEEQLRQAQKLEAIGGLAGGIAHDFNNLLSIILSYSELLMDDIDAEQPAHADLAEIHAAGKRAAELTRQLLAFSRKQVLSPRVLDLSAVVAGMEKMLRRLIGEDIELVCTFAPDLGRARLDPNQVEQVVMNLVINARDAMPDGGRISVETANVDLDELLASAYGCAPGLHVLLSVSDTGTGMDEAVRRRIFEPFFTTKPAGQGTGLGLSTVFGIVKQSEGSIWVHSELGRGTTFRIYFPWTDASDEVAPSRAPAPTLRGSETILLVEDDPAVRQLAIALLTRQGYRVIETSDVDDAIARCDEHPGKIDLLLTDVVMPRVSGPDLARTLVKRRPDLRVLFMSGYSDRGIVRQGVLESSAVFVQKPLTPDALARKVREALAAAPSAPSSKD
jgi:two-component system cell cycle sensor histidine kinase/response regulator CckA